MGLYPLKTFKLEEVEWEPKLRRHYENEALGMYVTDHPLRRHRRWCDANSDHPIGSLLSDLVGERLEVTMTLAGMFTNLHRHVARSGFVRASGVFEDETGIVEAFIPGAVIDRNITKLVESAPLAVRGDYVRTDEGSKFKVRTIRVPSAKELADGTETDPPEGE